jgi:hypothetical protein
MASRYFTKVSLALAVLAVTVLLQAAPALASCTYHTYTVNGRMVSCTTCCYGSMCNTNRF